MDIEEKYSQLTKLGAGDFDHLDGSLINHLKGTYELLKSWGAKQDLCNAGLFHAAYGIVGFDKSLVSENCRNSIKNIIGTKPEGIVYTYCACDRDFFWPQIGMKNTPVFLNRFTGEKYYLSNNELRNFCELTVANELEIARDNDEFIQKYYQSLSDLFYRMKPYISDIAKCNIKVILTKADTS